MVNTYYEIKTAGSGTFAMPFNTGSPNGWTVGETATFTFEFPDFSGTLTVSGTYTVSGVESYSDVTVQSGATLNIPTGTVLQTETYSNNGTVNQDGTFTINNGAGAALNDFVQWAGSWAPMEMLNNQEKYRIQLPTDAGIDSLLWGIEPNQDLADRNLVGVWGVIDSIQNDRNQPLTTNRYSVDVTVLAPIDEYATVGDVETDLVI